MVDLQDKSKPAELPRVVRILPNRLAPLLGLGAGLAFFSVLALLGSPAPGSHSGILIASAWHASALAVCALTVLGCGLRLLVMLPIIEASELGIAIWFHGPYRRPFFVPWSRVRAVVLTRVRRADASSRSAARHALGIELIADDRFCPPRQSTSHEIPVDGAPRADIAWSSRSIGGDLRRWARLLQQMRLAYTEPGE